MAKIVEKHIDSLIPDNRNFNRGTEYGDHLMEKSLRQFGLGRSVLIDKNDRIIAGNKTVEKAVEVGFNKVVVVETDGNTLVAVKRNDVDLDSAKGREMALADNATSHANLDFDTDVILETAEECDFSVDDWGIDLGENEETQEPAKKEESCPSLIVKCKDATQLSLLYEELTAQGFDCELKE